MSAYPIAQQHLCDQFRQNILVALRSGVPLETIQNALHQALRELAIAAPITAAALDSERNTT